MSQADSHGIHGPSTFPTLFIHFLVVFRCPILMHLHFISLLPPPRPGLLMFPHPTEFVSLGIMAYVGDSKALTQIEAGANSPLALKLYGSVAFLLWRSVYITKQVGGWGAAGFRT